MKDKMTHELKQKNKSLNENSKKKSLSNSSYSFVPEFVVGYQEREKKRKEFYSSHTQIKFSSFIDFQFT